MKKTNKKSLYWSHCTSSPLAPSPRLPFEGCCAISNPCIFVHKISFSTSMLCYTISVFMVYLQFLNASKNVNWPVQIQITLHTGTGGFGSALVSNPKRLVFLLQHSFHYFQSCFNQDRPSYTWWIFVHTETLKYANSKPQIWSDHIWSLCIHQPLFYIISLQHKFAYNTV